MTGVVIVGGTGYIGRRLVDRILEEGVYEPIVVTSRSPPQVVLEKNPSWKEKVRVVRWSPLEERFPADNLGDYVLVNLAGERITGLWTPWKKRRIWDTKKLKKN